MKLVKILYGTKNHSYQLSAFTASVYEHKVCPIPFPFGQVASISLQLCRL